MNDSLIELYQSECNYQITDNIQLLDFDIDIERLKTEILSFLIKNNFGTKIVSLRLPAGQFDYLDENEKLEETASPYYDFIFDNKKNPTIVLPENYKSNSEYLEWHPDLKTSYLASIVDPLEKFTGFKIGRIRLGWLRPNHGYRMHRDLEPMRLHIPIITNDVAYLIHEHKLYHMEYGKLYHLITTGLHTAFNFGMLPRLHLIFSTYGSDNISKQIENLSTKDRLSQNFADHISNNVDKKTLENLLQLSIKETTVEDRLTLISHIKSLISLLS